MPLIVLVGFAHQGLLSRLSGRIASLLGYASQRHDPPRPPIKGYTEFRALPSIGSIGDAYDNALMETINGLYKTECIRTNVFHDGPYKTIADVEYATASWTDWYNHRRLHSSLGYVPPIEAEHAHYAALNREPQPV